MATPLTIKIMLACYVSSDPISHVGEATWSSPAGIESRNWLAENGLIINLDATERGKAWVAHMCDTPLPILRWQKGQPTDPQG